MRVRAGLPGRARPTAFEQLPDFPEAEAAALHRRIVESALPALAARDFATFCAEVGALQSAMGAYFAPLQGGPYASAKVSEALGWLRGQGVSGLGQSSWGPTGFAFAASEAEGQALLTRACARRVRHQGLSFDAGAGPQRRRENRDNRRRNPVRSGPRCSRETQGMGNPRILHMITPLKHMSPFDVNMALDAGFDAAIPYTNVTTEDVTGLVQDAIFSRGPEGVKRTGMFIGGKRAIEALDMMDRAKKSMVPPFEISVFADPAGSFTTAAAMVALAKKALRDKFKTTLKGKRIAVFGGTGVVAFASAVIAAGDGASSILIGYDGPERVRKLADEARARFGVDISYADGSTEEQKTEIAREADVDLRRRALPGNDCSRSSR